MRRGDGERRTVLLALLAAAAALVALGVSAALPWLGAGPPPLVLVAVLLALGVGALWAALTLADQHFDDLERLRGALLIAADGPARGSAALEAAAAGGGAETRRLVEASARLVARQADGDGAALQGERLAAVLAVVAEGLVVVTDSGLVSLVNAAARRRLDAQRVAVGTSVFAALERAPLLAARQAAEAAGRPVPVTLRTVEGAPLRASVADLGSHNGLVLCLPEATATSPDGEPQPGAGPVLEHDLALHDAVPAMTPVADDTPLESLSALVLDSETTGLEVAEARVVSLGAVRLQGRRLYPHANLDCLVRPDVPIPAGSTKVHGIGDALVAEAPPIAELLPRLEALLGPGAVIGHNIGFDLTVLANEAARCGRTWQAPPSLDTGLLMAALEPGLKELDLERIAARLGVAVEGRHTALGDALVTAEIYLRLLPRLADAGVRTFGEARAFAAGAGRLRARQQAAGWRH